MFNNFKNFIGLGSDSQNPEQPTNAQKAQQQNQQQQAPQMQYQVQQQQMNNIDFEPMQMQQSYNMNSNYFQNNHTTNSGSGLRLLKPKE